MNLFAYTNVPSFSAKTSQSIENLRKGQNINQFLTWTHTKLGIGLTPLIELPNEVNPYSKYGVSIYVKAEYLNPSGSGKDRPVSYMLQHYNQRGNLNQINRITTAGYGNFIKSLSTLLPSVNPNITLETFMGQIVLNEHTEFTQLLKNRGVIIHTCDEGYCPTTGSERGKAISWAYLEEATDPTKKTLFLDQHGYYKPADGLLNAAGYYYSLAPEILNQTKSLKNLYYVNGEGTRGSLLGTSTGLKTMKPQSNIIGLTQTENGHIFGLRSKKELGQSQTLGNAEGACQKTLEISDKEAFKTMLQLWEVNIPASPSGGGYVAGALRVAEELYNRHEEATIVTLVFDSLELYKTILTIWVPRILNVRFKKYRKRFLDLSLKTQKERARHIHNVKA